MIIKNGNTFHLIGKSISYIMTVGRCGDFLHYYFGKKMADKDYSDRNMDTGNGQLIYVDDRCFLESLPHEYPAYGYSDLRDPAYVVGNLDGNTVSRLTYKDYAIVENEVTHIDGMPYIYAGKQNPDTLKITLADDIIGLEVVLSYTVFEEYDVILRSAEIINRTDGDMNIESAYSASIDFDKNCYDLVYFPGAWAREREFTRTEIKLGEKIDISNARGGSGHAMNPFVMLCAKDTTEKKGDVYGFSLIYSGNHSSMAECDQYGNVRVKQGINPFGFDWILESGASFSTPQCVLCYSADGFGGLSREMHDLYRNNLCKSKWAGMERPILINNWEGTYFDFTEEKLLNIAKAAKALGIEMFVLDDGWFGKRDNDNCSLGDWFVNEKKLPTGITGLAEKINSEGLKFGLWFEPEMVNPDSELYRKHPDWAISVPDRVPAKGRHQYILDLANDEVCDYAIESVAAILRTANVEYVKWDYNRSMTDMPYKGYNHRYILGLYKVMESMIREFPNVLFEGCASGGGRFDPGMLAYSPQIWTSDNSDAISRLKIQYSTSICYPLSTMSAHVTASPNHQVGRVTPLKTRADVAYAGVFGYELDITMLSDDELEKIKSQVEFVNKIRTLTRTGDLYRLQSPYEGNYCSWQVVSKDKSEVLLFACRILSPANFKEANICLDGLDEAADYIDTETNEIWGGSELMYKGITPMYENCDFATVVKLFKRV